MRATRAVPAAAITLAAALAPGGSSALWLPWGSNINVDPLAVSDSPAMALAASETFIAWSEDGQIQVKYRPHTAAAWTRAGKTCLNRRPKSQADSPDITAIGSTPYVVWREDLASGADAIYVKCWSGSGWAPLGGNLTVDPSAYAGYPSIATDGTTVYASWDEYDSARGWYNIYVKYWDSASGSWLQVGGNLDMDPANGDGTLPDIEFDNAGTPYVAWSELNLDTYISRVHVKYWDGSTWVPLGGSLNMDPAGFAFYPDLIIDQRANRTYAAWGEDGQIYVKCWDAASSSWLPVGGAVGTGWVPSIATYASRPIPFVAYAENVSPDQLYVKYWDGSAWTMLGTGSLNYSSTYSAEGRPALQFLKTGLMSCFFCAWAENNRFGGRSIGVKQWR